MARRFVKVLEEEIEEAFFIHLIWSILKQLPPSGSVKSGEYIPRRFASRSAKTILFILNLDSWQKLIKNTSVGNIGFCSYIIL